MSTFESSDDHYDDGLSDDPRCLGLADVFPLLRGVINILRDNIRERFQDCLARLYDTSSSEAIRPFFDDKDLDA